MGFSRAHTAFSAPPSAVKLHVLNFKFGFLFLERFSPIRDNSAATFPFYFSKNFISSIKTHSHTYVGMVVFCCAVGVGHSTKIVLHFRVKQVLCTLWQLVIKWFILVQYRPFIGRLLDPNLNQCLHKHLEVAFSYSKMLHGCHLRLIPIS